MFYPPRGIFASTELDVQMVGTVEVNDEDPLGGVDGGAGSVLMTDVEAKAQFKKAAALVEPIFPNLWTC